MEVFSHTLMCWFKEFLDPWVEFSSATSQGIEKPSMSIAPSQLCWAAPSTGWFKVNWDASFHKNRGWMGFEVVVRDDKGCLVVALGKMVVGCLDPTVAEARALLMAIKLCKDLGLRNTHFEGDAQGVINAINSLGTNWSNKGLLADDIKRELDGLSLWKVMFIRKEGNRVAHVLSKEATTSFLDKDWLFELPDCIRELVLMELNACTI